MEADDAEEIKRLTAENEMLKGAMNADDERLRKAGERVGVIAGCDNPDWMADKILSLRAWIAKLEDTAIIDGMKADCIGEFTFEKEVTMKDAGDLLDEQKNCLNVMVPWTAIKEIYKKMHESKLRLIAAKGDSDGK